MTKAMRVRGGRVVTVVDVPEGLSVTDMFHPDAGYLEHDGQAEVGWVEQEDGTFAAPSAELPDDVVIDNVRSQRNGILSATDPMISVPDWPITEEQRAALWEYRQELRDMTALPISHGSIPWPVWPEGLNPPPGLVVPQAIGEAE